MSNTKRIAPTLFDPKDLIRRHSIILIMSLFFGSLATTSTGFELYTLEWVRNIGFNFIYIATIWNGNIGFISLLDKKVKWEHEIKKFIGIIITIEIINGFQIFFFSYLSSNGKYFL